MASVTVRTRDSNDTNDQRKIGKRVALLGDSITDFNYDFTQYPTTVYANARGFATWANVLIRQRMQMVFPSTTDGAWGASGMTAAAMLTNGEANGAAASASDVVIVLAGTNDITDANNYTAAQIAANLQTIWNRILVTGKSVVAMTVMPRNNADNATQVQKLKDLNRLIRKNANSTPGVFLCDWYSVVLDPSTGLANSSTYYVDGVHPNSIGASRLGAALAQVLDRVFPPGVDDLALDENDLSNYVATGALMRGTGGSLFSATGSLANNWTIYGSNSAQVTCSKVTRSDLVPGEWQQVVISGGGNFTMQVYGNIGGTNQPAVGDLVYATVEFETDATGWAGTQLGLMVEFNGSSNTSRGLAYSEQLVITRPPSGIFRTPTFPIPSGATLWKLDIIAYGNGTYRFGRSQLVKPT